VAARQYIPETSRFLDEKFVKMRRKEMQIQLIENSASRKAVKGGGEDVDSAGNVGAASVTLWIQGHRRPHRE
jgi:hypothetical protein